MNINSVRLVSLFLGLGPVFGADAVTDATTAGSPASRIAWVRHAAHPTSGLRLTVLDLNRDGVISAAELANAPIVLSVLASESDGSVSITAMLRPRERRSGVATATGFFWPGAEKHRAVGRGLLSALDANRDGSLQPMEIANAVLSLRALDRNGDGQITADELADETFAEREV